MSASGQHELPLRPSNALHQHRVQRKLRSPTCQVIVVALQRHVLVAGPVTRALATMLHHDALDALVGEQPFEQSRADEAGATCDEGRPRLSHPLRRRHHRANSEESVVSPTRLVSISRSHHVTVDAELEQEIRG